MNMIHKSALVEKLAAGDGELELINRYSLRPLKAEEVFIFRLAACNNQVDRDHEHFTDAALEGFAKLFPGKPALIDHLWSAKTQTARIYAAEVESDGDVKRLMLRCYMPRLETNADVIAAIESGILRECSVGVSVASAVCDICGTELTSGWCEHLRGKEYNGKLCTVSLDKAVDAYEVSFVAVPAQPEAGVTKSKRYGGPEEPPAPPEDGEREKLARAMQAQAEKRYGGI